MRGQKGITLIALIITIVVLLILAVVAIASINDTDLLNKSENAAKTWNNAVERENAEITNYESYLNKYTNNYMK